MHDDVPSQPIRLFAALGYLAILVATSGLLTGALLPPFDLRGAWLYTAAVSLIINRSLVEPFFTRPADALATAAVIFIAVTTGSSAGGEVPPNAVAAGRYWFAAYSLAVVLLAAAAILLKDQPRLGFVAQAATRLVRSLGRSDVGFGALMVATAISAFAAEPSKLFVVLVLWLVIVEAAPIESLLHVVQSVRLMSGELGHVEAIQDPQTFLARINPTAGVDVGALVLVGPKRVQAVVVDVTRILARPGIRATLAQSGPLSVGWPVYRAPEHPHPVIGWVEAGTETQALVLRAEPQVAASLEEGELVEVAIGNRKALYQVIQASVMAMVDAGLPREAIRITAQKLGAWDDHARAFRSIPWLPQPGTPVYLLAEQVPAFDRQAIGSLPHTNFGIRLDVNGAVTHNTAIIGILGIGKTRLAWELMRRAIAAGVKVVAMDITGRYSIHFSDLHPPQTERVITEWINEATKSELYSKKVFSGESGNIALFRKTMIELLSALADSESSLLVLNPSDLKVSRLEGFINKSGQADNLALLTAAEVTAIISEAFLAVAKERDAPTDEDVGKYWLVLDEAHSLIPERDATASSAEHRAAGVTARAIMQGRKYGYGCLLITQRTANVIKSVLNQCNTVFGMRIYDATGIDFLGNYIGTVYAQLLTHLGDREAVVFGRASSCNAPVIIRVNETDQVIQHYWHVAVTSVRATKWDG